MKVLVCLALFMSTLTAQARLIAGLNYEQLKELADAIVIIQFVDRAQADDAPPFADKHHPAENYQAWNGRFRVLSVLKSSQEVGDELTLVYFNYASGNTIANNGAGFLHFPDEPENVFRMQTDDGTHHGKWLTMASSGDLVGGHMPSYLAYLKLREDGRYEVVGDQYDANVALKELSFPFPYSEHQPARSSHEDE